MGSADATVFGDGDLGHLLPEGLADRLLADLEDDRDRARRQRRPDGRPDGPGLPGTGHFLVQGASRAALVSADARDSMQRQAATVASGKAPTNAHEVMVSQPLADHLGSTSATRSRAATAR